MFRSCLLILLFVLKFNFSYSQDSSIIHTTANKEPKDIVVKYGIASYYAKKFEGRKTFTDKIYNSNLLTAACNVLPMGTWVKVTNLKNGKTVVVEINDHLAKWNKRLIDLTYRAAKDLGYIGSGITKVKVEVLGELKTTHKKQHSKHRKNRKKRLHKHKKIKAKKIYHKSIKS